MKKTQKSLSVPGISLLLLIFLTLCLITFSLLSLSGSTADASLSQKAADRTAAYYAASDEANGILAQIDGHLADFLRQAAGKWNPKGKYKKLCRQLPELVEGCSLDGDTVSFSVPVTDDQILSAELKLLYPKEPDDVFYEITMWKIVNTGEWNPDTRQKLYIPG